MTSISKASDGEMTQFKQNLSTAGLTLEDIRRVNKRPELATVAVIALQAMCSAEVTLADTTATHLWPDSIALNFDAEGQIWVSRNYPGC